MLIGTFKVDMIPAVRMTTKNKWVSPQAKKYLSFKKSFSNLLKYKIDGRVNKDKDARYKLSCSVYLPHKHKPDVDNLLKTIMDSLQYAGLIENDRQIREIGYFKVIDGHCEGVLDLCLEEI